MIETDHEDDNINPDPETIIVYQENNGNMFTSDSNIWFFSEKHLKFHSFWLSSLHEKDSEKNRFHVSSANPNAGSILISFVLGCAGFFLLIVVLTMVIVTLASEEQIHITSDPELMVEDCEDLVDG